VADRLWSGWYDAVLIHAPGCPIAVADFAIKRSAIEFCVESQAWRKAVPSIDSVAGTGEYTLPAVAAGVMVAKLLETRWLGKELVPTTPEKLRDIYGPNDWRVLQGTPTRWLQETVNTVRVVPAPTATTVAAINGLWAAVRPTDTATGIDDAVATGELRSDQGRGPSQHLRLAQQAVHESAARRGVRLALPIRNW
jgi:hypothetical protein